MMVNDLSFRLSTSSLFDRWDASKQNITSSLSYTESAYYLVTQASSSKSTVLKLSANSKDLKARGGFFDVQKYFGTAKLVAFHTEFLTRFKLLVCLFLISNFV